MSSVLTGSRAGAVRVTGATPESIAGIATLSGDHLAHRLSALRAFRRAGRPNGRIARFKSGRAHALGEAALLREVLGCTLHLTRQKRAGAANDDQQSVRCHERIFVFKPLGTPTTHAKRVFTVFVIDVFRLVECVQLEGPHGSVALIALRPGRLTRIDDERLVIARKFVQRTFGDVKLLEFLLFGRRRP